MAVSLYTKNESILSACTAIHYILLVTMESRKSVEIPFLKEAPISELLGAKLPTCMTVFRHFWHKYKILGQKLSVAQRETAKSVICFWKNAGLVPKKVDCIIVDIEKWFKEYQVIFVFD